MSVTPLLLDSRVPSVQDDRVPLAFGKPEGRPEGEKKNLSSAIAAPSKGEERAAERVEVWQEEVEEPVTNVLQSQLEFSQDQDTGRTVIKMYDPRSGELIREIPPEDALTFLRQLAEDRKGVLVSRRL